MKKTLLLILLVAFHFINGHSQTCMYTDTSWLVHTTAGIPLTLNWRTTNNTNFVQADTTTVGSVATLTMQQGALTLPVRYPGVTRKNMIWRNSLGNAQNLVFKKVLRSCHGGSGLLASVTIRFSADDRVDSIWFNGTRISMGPLLVGWSAINTVTIPASLITTGNNYLCIQASDVSASASWLLAEVCTTESKACFTLADTICEGGSVVPNLACMPADINYYNWIIYEETAAGSWTTVYSGPMLSGPVVPANMLSLWNFQPCKRYKIKIDVIRTCNGSYVSESAEDIFYTAPRPRAIVPEELMLSCAASCVNLSATPLTGAACETGVTLQWKKGSTLLAGNPASDCPPSFPATYTVTLNNNFGCTKTYVTIVRKDTCCLNPCFTLADTICENSSVVPNLGCMQQNVSSYRWVIAEEVGAGWMSVYTGPYLPGPVVPVNMYPLWTFQPCKRYKVTIEVLKTCNGNTISGSASRIFYSTPRPKATVTEELLLSCTENCATLNATVLPGAACETGVSVQWKNGSTLYVGNPVTVCPAATPVSYSVKLSNNFGCTRTYITTVRKDSCCLNPCFNLPDTICEGDPLYPDLSCMQTNITMYRWVIHRMNPPASWTPICSTAYLYGPVVPIDFSAMCTLTPGYSYGISIDVFKDCPGGNINSSTYREVYVKAKQSVTANLGFYPGTTVDLADIVDTDIPKCPGQLLYVEDLVTGTQYWPPSLGFTTTGAHHLLYHYECCVLDLHIYEKTYGMQIPDNSVASKPAPDASDRQLNKNKQAAAAKNMNFSRPSDINMDGAWLAQNFPNPFSVTSEIRYQLPENTKTAMISIYDITGRKVKSYPVNTLNNKGSVTINRNELQPGMYFYKLVVNGTTFDTKQMVFTD